MKKEYFLNLNSKILNILIISILFFNILSSSLITILNANEDNNEEQMLTTLNKNTYIEEDQPLLPVDARDLYNIVGAARFDGDNIVLTEDLYSQVGTAYLKNDIDMSKDFTLNVDIDAGEDKGKPNTIADGIGLALHNSP